MEDDDNKIRKKFYEIGGNLDSFSIDDLDNYLSKLDEEISRVKITKKIKTEALTKADSFFKGK